MPNRFRLSEEPRFSLDTNALGRSPERAVKNLRYVMGSVNDDALRAWSDLWEQLKTGVTPAGVVVPEMQEGFEPACGWAEFLEKFWLLKHYLDYMHRFCKDTSPPA